VDSKKTTHLISWLVYSIHVHFNKKAQLLLKYHGMLVQAYYSFGLMQPKRTICIIQGHW